MIDEADNPYVSRGGLKLAAALDAFGVGVDGAVCVDLGCNVGGFTDCLLQRGAARVYAVDTGYGALAWKLRQDGRVVVMERCNALHVDVPGEIAKPPLGRELGAERQAAEGRAGSSSSPAGAAGVDLAVIDLGWTPQRHALPAALRWMPRGIVTLIKPHYEMTSGGGGERDASKKGGRRGKAVVLDDAEAERIVERTLSEMDALGVRVRGCIRSPVRGGAGKGKAGNAEWLAWCEPAVSPAE